MDIAIAKRVQEHAIVAKLVERGTRNGSITCLSLFLFILENRKSRGALSRR